VIHLLLPFALAAVLAGSGVYGVLARRNAVLMLVGVELILASASLILVTMSTTLPDDAAAGQILTIFVITLAAAEVTLALGIILAAFRLRGHIDLTERLDDDAAHAPVDGRTDGRVTS
jgi:NADH-quinone oxidoreductase subunit K